MNIKEISDDELLMLISSQSEEAKELIFEKNKYIIDILTNKYYPAFFKLGIDKSEIYSEALYGFTDAINSFNGDKNATFATFLSLCIRRRIIKLIRKYNALKNKINTDAYSLDYAYDPSKPSLIETIEDELIKDPLYQITEEEDLIDLTKQIKSRLSEFEYEVYEYMLDGLNYQDIALLMDKNIKQIDNAMQRIKLKVKEILYER